MRLLLSILFSVFIYFPLSAQGVTKSGQNSTTGINFVNKYGKIVNYPALTKYGQELFTLSISTTAVTSITTNSARSGGSITPDGGGTVISRGICWATTSNPTTANRTTADGSGSGSFTSYITGLVAGTTYYVRAYATYSSGTYYGNMVTFTTQVQVQGYETLSSAVYSEFPREINDITFGNVHFTKITDGPVNCGSQGTFLAKTLEDAYSIVGSDPVINYNLSNPVLQRFVEDGINCEVFDISGEYIYYGHSRAFYRINKNTFGNKIKFLISGIWEGALGLQCIRMQH